MAHALTAKAAKIATPMIESVAARRWPTPFSSVG